MRAFLKIVSIQVVTGSLLIWAFLAMGWSDLFDLPGFESTKTPNATRVAEVNSTPSGPIAKSAAPSVVTSEPVTEPKLAAVGRSETKSETKPEVKVEPIQPPAASSVTSPIDRSKPTAPAVAVAVAPAVVQPAPVELPRPRIETPPAVQPMAPVVVIAPTQRAAPVVSAPREPVAVDPPRAEAMRPDASRPESARVPPPPPVRKVEVAPIPVAPLPAAQPEAPRRVDVAPPRVMASPQPSPSRTWAPSRRIAGFGADALVDQLDEPRRAADDVPCVVFEQVQFRAGTAAPMRAAPRELDLIATSLATTSSGRIEIGSRIGTTRMTPANMRLAADRAQFVRNALVSRGVSPERLAVDTRASYHELLGDDLGRMGIKRVPSVGLCVMSSAV